MAASDEYEKITTEFIEKMNRVEAPLTDFIAGCRAAKSELDISIEAAEGDLENETQRNDVTGTPV